MRLWRVWGRGRRKAEVRGGRSDIFEYSCWLGTKEWQPRLDGMAHK